MWHAEAVRAEIVKKSTVAERDNQGGKSMIITRRKLLVGSAAGAVALTLGSRAFAALPPLAKKDKYKVGFAQTESNNPWRLAETKSMQEEAAKLGHQLVYTDAAGSSAKQASDVNSMIAQGVDAIFLPPREDKPLVPVILAARDAGIPVFLVDRDVDHTMAKPGEDYVCFIGSDFIEEATRIGQWLVKNANGKSKTARKASTISSPSIRSSPSWRPSPATSLATRAGRSPRRCFRRILTRTSSTRIMTRWRWVQLPPWKPPARPRARMC
jgi:hypothetical protein